MKYLKCPVCEKKGLYEHVGENVVLHICRYCKSSWAIKRWMRYPKVSPYHEWHPVGAYTLAKSIEVAKLRYENKSKG